MSGSSPREDGPAAPWHWLLLAIAAILRVRAYLANPPLWHDEAALALNLIERSSTGLFGALDYTQAAPVGFLLLTKLVLLVFGTSEFALRLVPLGAALVALFFFYAVAKRILPSPGVFAAVALFALSRPLIHYGAELKPYEMDACVMLGLLFLFSRRTAPVGALGAVRLAALGAVAVWLSYPSVFVLAGLGLPLLLRSLGGGERRRLVWLCGAYGFWIANAAWLYSVSGRAVAADSHVVRYWSSGFMPLPPQSLDELRWFPRALGGALRNAAGLRPSWVAATIAGVGYLSLFASDRRAWWNFTLPALVTLLASGLHLYPFQGRVITFLVPLVYLLAGAGFAFLWQSRRRPIAALLLAALLVPAGVHQGELFVHPPAGTEIPSALAYARSHWRRGDLLYVYSGAEYAFRYYSRRFGFAPEDFRIGYRRRKHVEKILEEIEDLRTNGRLWLLFAHVWRSDRLGGEQPFLHCLNRWGTMERAFRPRNASLYLFSMRAPAREDRGRHTATSRCSVSEPRSPNQQMSSSTKSIWSR